jgi:uncharacterized protein (TIGR02757 family)
MIGHAQHAELEKTNFRQNLNKIYKKFTKKSYVHPDPLEFLYNYTSTEDIELVGLIASSLAYGRVELILKAVSSILDLLGDNPKEALFYDNSYLKKLNNFKYRFTDSNEIKSFLKGLKKTIKEYGSLEALFNEALRKRKDLVSSQQYFVDKIKQHASLKRSSLLPDPEKGSASKRLNLFFRWMIRKDNVDPGSWSSISPSKLIIPLDTHMFYFGKCYGFTNRKAADLKTAIEITENFKYFEPNDPVKYDFSLTRFGIRRDLCWTNLDGDLNEI